jgi:hypothetical protein
VTSLLTAHPLEPRTVVHYRDWCAALRERRDEFERSRLAAGLDRFQVWSQPDAGLAVVRLDGDDPLAALERLEESTDEFDRWYHEREMAFHRVPLRAVASVPAELVADHHHAPVDPFDPYMAMALPLLPGRADAFRAIMRRGVETGDGPAHASGWGVNRLTVHIQRVDDCDVVLYEVSGDLPRMVREVAGIDSPAMRLERRLFRDHFGIDLAAGELPVPEPAFAWSAPPPSRP